MKTTSTTITPVGVVTTIRIDGEAVARFFGSGSAEAAKQFNDAATLSAENKRLREALGSVIGLASSYVESQCMRTYEPTIEAARAALKGGAQ